MDQQLKKNIDKVMQSLDDIEKASPRPFFFTRLEGRLLKKKSPWEAISGFVAKPVVAFGCICLIIMVNAVVILSSAKAKVTADQQNSEQATADEYNSLSAPLYEFVNSRP